MVKNLNIMEKIAEEHILCNQRLMATSNDLQQVLDGYIKYTKNSIPPICRPIVKYKVKTQINWIYAKNTKLPSNIKVYMIVNVTPRVLLVNEQSISVCPNSMLFLHSKKEQYQDSTEIQSTSKVIITM